MLPPQLLHIVKNAVTVTDRVVVMREELVREQIIDALIDQAVFGEGSVRPVARWLIWEIAQELGIYPSSIHPFYSARGRRVVPSDFTVPAMNFRGMSYDISRALFKTASQTKTKAFICELARGEMSYTAQSPMEYTIAMLAGAIKEGYTGPVFIQGDHFQTKSGSQPGTAEAGEVEALVKLIQEALEAGFLNIDIDASTLVDLSLAETKDQQEANIHYTAELLKLIRSIEPAGITVSVGGEIGHIGGRNSTMADFEAFMEGLKQECGEMALISKISVATGTSHGGVVKPDGTMAAVEVAFEVLESISRQAMEKYGMAGAVQHGASTLPDTLLHEFPKTQTTEIHLATGFQNYLMDNDAFPKELLTEMYRWLDTTKQTEREPDWTDEQFHYRLRKKCWGQFKKEVWGLPATTREALRQALEQRFELIFRELNVTNSEAMVEDHVPVNPIHKEIVDFAGNGEQTEVNGLAD